jgi:GNAT superfamily N-acetyltransferase
MIAEVHHRCAEATGYRAARVKSLFNCESGAEFHLRAELPLEGLDWQLGVIVGPSGSGKTSLGHQLGSVVNLRDGWSGAPIIEDIAPGAPFDVVPAALTAVGLGSVPSRLRPFAVLSNGEQFRAGLARLLVEAQSAPGEAAPIVVDEWTSVIDRQIARVGSLAFAKAWRRTKGRAVLLSCHRDVLPWLQPDWIFDTATGRCTARYLRRRPTVEVELWETDWRYWPLFEPHHYLKLGRMICARCYVAAVEGEPVAHVAVSPRLDIGHMRACRLVVMPEWQGCGLGMRFLNAVCQRQLDGGNKWGRKCPTLFHTSHPGLAAALRRDAKWRQVSASLCGNNKARSAASLVESALRKGTKLKAVMKAGYGGHFRAVQGFRYIGEEVAS